MYKKSSFAKHPNFSLSGCKIWHNLTLMYPKQHPDIYMPQTSATKASFSVIYMDIATLMLTCIYSLMVKKRRL